MVGSSKVGAQTVTVGNFTLADFTITFALLTAFFEKLHSCSSPRTFTQAGQLDPEAAKTFAHVGLVVDDFAGHFDPGVGEQRAATRHFRPDDDLSVDASAAEKEPEDERPGQAGGTDDLAAGHHADSDRRPARSDRVRIARPTI
jgi:hypothetical protein